MFLSLLSRLYAGMIASRQRKAVEELKRHGAGRLEGQRAQRRFAAVRPLKSS